MTLSGGLIDDSVLETHEFWKKAILGTWDDGSKIDNFQLTCIIDVG